MAKADKKKSSKAATRNDAPMRIIGGKFRNKKLAYSGDPLTRPMKERVREAVFNLIGPSIKGKHAIDLFAGTGALGLESLSRGAKSALLIERHVPTTKLIRENIENLEVNELCTITAANTFIWARRLPPLPKEPWVVFCCPPYDFFLSRRDETISLIASLIEQAPQSSIFIVESDGQFDSSFLPEVSAWDIRQYNPAVVGIYRKD